MKKITALVLVFMTVFLLFGCTRQEEATLTPTGYPSGEIQQPQVMYSGKIYLYTATGFDAPLPRGYVQVGSVESIDNINTPAQEFCGARIALGQKIFAKESDPSSIYVQYESGYARFFVEGYSLQEVACYVRLITEDGLYVEHFTDTPDMGCLFIKYPNALQEFDCFTVYVTFSVTDLKPESGTFTTVWGEKATYSYILENVTNIRMPNPGEPTYG